MLTSTDEDGDATDSPYLTPHGYYSDALRTGNLKGRQGAVDSLMEAFGLTAFDAETVASAAADVSQIKDAVKKVRFARRGSVSVKYIELDVVTWRIVPSPENIRFEEERVRAVGRSSRFRSLADRSPVLVFEEASSSRLSNRLETEAETILVTNEHALTVGDRGIENPGLLSISRIQTSDRETVGVLDSTDGFGRTVGAHHALGIRASDALWKYSNEAESLQLRKELIQLRLNPHDSADKVGAHLSVENQRRLRASVMLRAQIIVGYEASPSEANNFPQFDQVRRTLVGYIHIEPPKPFSLGTQYAIKATAVLQALSTNEGLPSALNFSQADVQAILEGSPELTGPGPRQLSDGRRAFLPDEAFVLALEALRSSAVDGHRRARIANAAIRELTGQTPSKADRSMIAADSALKNRRTCGGKD